MKILIVSGFLGAGKTTFIKKMAEKTSHDLVVMENEYGEIEVDKILLEEDRSLNIWELTEGCICCSMKSDFASSVLTIANTLDPEYLIVEPTGAALLSNVIANLRQIEYERISLLSPVTVVDADGFDRCLAEYSDIFLDQLKAAGTIVISKRSFTSAEEVAPLISRLRSINPFAPVQFEHYSTLDGGWWETLLSTGLNGNHILPPKQSATEMENLGLSGISLPGPNHLIAFLEEMIRGRYGRICRAKGFVEAGGCLLRFDIVGDRYTVTGFSGETLPKSVFIGENLNRNRLRKKLLADFQTDTKSIRINRPYPRFRSR